MGLVQRWRANRTTAFWANRRGEEWLGLYRESVDRPYRAVLVERVAQFQPKSILELGCNVGPNLRLFADRLPNAEIVGIDINEHAIADARQGLAAYPNVEVRHGDLRGGLAGPFDCVVTCYTLACISPRDIQPLLESAWGSARKGLVLMEPHRKGEGWLHDYAGILRSLGARTETEDVDGGAWGLDAVTVASRRP